MSFSREQLRAEDDGLPCPDVGRWAETKYRLIAMYDQLFATGMKYKWDQRVYIDLYSGAGFARVHGTSTILKGSPILALSVKDPFDKYIFCEENPVWVEALRDRSKRVAPTAKIEFVERDCDSAVDEICARIPKASAANKVLSLCCVDPFDFGIKFETLRRLSRTYMDFLVLLAVGMDANRNYEHYVEGNSEKIDLALGNVEWRKRWKAHVMRSDFRSFLAREFALSMESLEYLHQEIHQMKLVRSTDKNLPLYYLALFSRNEVAYGFWKDVLKYAVDQTTLWD